jgi:hypothetical protein
MQEPVLVNTKEGEVMRTTNKPLVAYSWKVDEGDKDGNILIEQTLMGEHESVILQVHEVPDFIQQIKRAMKECVDKL